MGVACRNADDYFSTPTHERPTAEEIVMITFEGQGEVS